ncbi:MAG: Ig-like domain-containing protein, partial [Bacteroidota bacterium]
SNGDIYAATGLGFGQLGRIHRSEDDGITWTEITPPLNTQLRIELAVAPSQSATTETTRIYAVAQDRSNFIDVAWFLRSDDGGATWSQLTIPQYREQNCFTSGRDFTRGQAFYDLILAVAPNDADVVTMGGINVLRSENGGITTAEVSYWTGGCDSFVHADIHEITFRPGFPNEALVGTDGGVYYSPNLGNFSDPSFQSRNQNYSVTQFYAVAAANEAGSDYFLAGSQDNGTQQFTTSGGLSTRSATGGDGGYTHIDQTDARFQVTSFTRNSINHSSNGGVSFRRFLDDQSSGLFINPTDLDNSSHVLYSAGNNNQLFRLRNINSSNPDAQESLSLSIGRVTHIQANALATDRVFVGNTVGEVYRIDNANSANPQVTLISQGINAFGSVSSVAIGASDDQLVATFSNFGVSSVWYTADGGSTWINKDESSHGLPDMPIRWAIFAPNDATQLLLATDLGIWSSDNITDSNPGWEPTNNNLSNVRCSMLKIRSADDVLVVATYGRGLFTTNAFSDFEDSTPPAIVSLTPADDEIDVARSQTFEVTFNEVVVPGVGDIEIRRSADDSLFEALDVSG